MRIDDPHSRPQSVNEQFIAENRSLRRQWANDPSVRLLLDFDTAIRRAAQAVAGWLGRV